MYLHLLTYRQCLFYTDRFCLFTFYINFVDKAIFILTGIFLHELFIYQCSYLFIGTVYCPTNISFYLCLHLIRTE
jgi:hypothetical protein